MWIEYIVVQKEFRRRGIGAALLQKLKDYATSSSIDGVYAFINPDNEPSMRLHSKAGFRREGIMRKRSFIRGEWTDIILYSILREEWKEPKILTKAT